MERKEIMKKLLLITGDLATGKSTFADILSKRYDTNVFYKDTIKEVLGDTIGFSNREENLKLSKATMELMIFMLKEFCKIDKNLILEANFRKADLERLHEIAYENGYDVLTLAIHGEVEILHKRYLNRMNNENRHPVHLSTTLDIFDDFKEYIENSRKEEMSGEVMQISANSFSYQTDEKILNCIDQFMRNE